MPWFPIGRNNEPGWRLDIVSLLAVIGESSISVHSQEITSSWLCLLPRLIPAPQALLRPFRPVRIQHAPACKIAGVYSGSHVDEINFFANLIHDIQNLAPFEFRVYEIEWDLQANEDKGSGSSAHNAASDSTCQSTKAEDPSPLDVEHGRQKQQKKSHSASPSKDANKAPMVPPKRYSPMNFITIGSCALSLGIFIWAGVIRDATAMLAMAFISLASSMVGLALWWRPVLATRTAFGVVPKGDLVIWTRWGAFVVVRCNEKVARELYIGRETCDYVVKNIKVVRALSGTATACLMVAVILLGNCSWTMQGAIGVAYLVLNGLYWGASLLHKKHFWDLSRYKVKDITASEFQGAERAHEDVVKERPPNYTRSLWYTIRSTKSINWVKHTGAAPFSRAWDEWLSKALEESKKDVVDWDAEGYRETLMASAASEEQ